MFNGQPQGLSILGSTGSIGTQTLDIVRLFPHAFQVQVLTAGSNADLLIQQAYEFKPACVVIGDATKWTYVNEALAGQNVEVLTGYEGLIRAATFESVHTVVAALVGFVGLRPVIAAIKAGKKIALANKETLVVAGSLIRHLLTEYDVSLIPVDSEHSAIFQCLVGEDARFIESLILTASGGPFRKRDFESFASITRAEALNHPNWDMGAKITIDSATMMNKGLEVIEARWMFDVEPAKIEVLVHPQSIIHSMVTFVDGSVKAQLGVPDMRVPIQYALTYPRRLRASHPRVGWKKLRSLDFEPPDYQKFPCLRLAFEALVAGGTAPAVLNAANEVAVAAFLADHIRFIDIPRLIEGAMEKLATPVQPSLDSLVEADAATRRYVQELYPVAVD